MKNVKKILIGAAVMIILLALLSVTLLNRHSRTMRMTSLMREGRLAVEAHDYDEAIDIYRLAISVNERSVDAYMALAEACIEYGELEDALYFLRMGMKKTNSKKLRDAHEELLRMMAVYDDDDYGDY